VRRENVLPPSVVASTDWFANTRYPTFADGKSNDESATGQFLSLAEKGSRLKVSPPSSDRRREHPPPTTMWSGESTIRT
jgi:hypothetical protein